jgi:hypothetical protein
MHTTLLFGLPDVECQCYSMLPAITLDGFITYKVVEGSTTAEIFHDFLENHVVSARNHSLKLSVGMFLRVEDVLDVIFLFFM